MLDEIINDHIQNVGQAILDDSFFKSRSWDSIAIAVTVLPGQRSYEGFIYADDEHTPASPDRSRPITKTVIDLQSATTPPGAEPWKQALIHITKPGPKINIKFEYDDPTRWSLKKVSLDMADYAESLRPPRD